MRRKHRENRPPAHDYPAAPKPQRAPSGKLIAPLGVCVFLLAAVFVVFYQTASFDFVNLDDPTYVYDNPNTTAGLTLQGVKWAFTTDTCANWHPVAWFSHMLDCGIYGPHKRIPLGQGGQPGSLFAGGHHLTSAMLHAAAAVLLFLTLWRMTDALWPSALVAAVFAIHPLRAESVAWIAERKDVLSGLFFMLVLATYAGYARQPFSWVRYLSVVVLFALGLMAKPMLVTLPFVLLLLDYWPLGRMPLPGSRNPEDSPRWQFPWRLVVEKMPLLLLTAVFCVITPLAQTEAVVSVEHLPPLTRFANALVSYVTYIGDFFFPVDLAALYPLPPDGWPAWKVLGSLAILLGISAGAALCWRRIPAVTIGWLWYLGMLVPVIGLVQVGSQAHADRYTYLPQIGLAIAAVWGSAELTRAWPYRRWICGAASTVVVVALIICASRQTSYWRDSVTLWQHTLECTEKNAFAHHSLGCALNELKQYEPAVEQFEKALAIKPKLVESRFNLGLALFSLNRLDDAIVHYRKALEIDNKLVRAHSRLAEALLESKKYDAAVAEYRKVLELTPDDANACYNIGVARDRQAKRGEALAAYREAMAIQPNNVVFIDQVAWILATSPDRSLRNGAEAVALAERAVTLSGDNTPSIFATLAAAYAEAGRFDDAIRASQYAIALATRSNDSQSAALFGIQMKFYQARSPYHERDEQPR
jgi:protein O-mannosyl-transferase